MPSALKTTRAAPPKALRAVRKPSTATTGEQVAKQLGEAILQGRYAPGERVGEQAVAEMFALSRGPVRDALRLLERQGLVEILPRRGAYVIALRFKGDHRDWRLASHRPRRAGVCVTSMQSPVQERGEDRRLGRD